MQKWEYKRIELNTGYRERGVTRVDDKEFKYDEMPKVTDYLRELGAQGWEMVATLGSSIYFKRPIEE